MTQEFSEIFKNSQYVLWEHTLYLPQLISYSQALSYQERLTLVLEGKPGWLFFHCKPTITLGKRAEESHILLDKAEINKAGIQVQRLDRGGLVTYHGPGQVLGFPWGKLDKGVRQFVCDLQNGLKKFTASYLLEEGDRCVMECEDVGVYEQKGKGRRKIASIGLRFHRTGISHGFALNLYYPDNAYEQVGFHGIVACGDAQTKPGFIFEQPITKMQFEEAIQKLASYLEPTVASQSC